MSSAGTLSSKHGGVAFVLYVLFLFLFDGSLFGIDF